MIDDNEPTRRDIILAHASDQAIDFVYYDRKECEDLPMDAIEDAILAGEVTVDDIAEAFAKGLRDSLRHILGDQQESNEHE